MRTRIKCPQGYAAHVLLFAVITSLTLFTRAHLAGRYSEQVREIARRSTREKTHQLHAIWKALVYADPAREEVRRAFLTNSNWSSLEISSLQRAQLEIRLNQILSYLHNPTFERYWGLRTDGLNYKFTPTAHAKWLLTNSSLNGSVEFSESESKSIPKLIWDMVRARKGSETPTMTGLCLEQISAALSATNSIHSLISGKLSKGYAAIVEAGNPGFQYDSLRQCDSPLLQPPVFLHASFFAQANDGDAGPVYLSLQWLDREQQWLLTRLVSDAGVGLGLLF